MKETQNLKLGDKVELFDVDGTSKKFTVRGVNRVTYTVVHEWMSEKWGKQSISRSLRKDNLKLIK